MNKGSRLVEGDKGLPLAAYSWPSGPSPSPRTPAPAPWRRSHRNHSPEDGSWGRGRHGRVAAEANSESRHGLSPVVLVQADLLCAFTWLTEPSLPHNVLGLSIISIPSKRLFIINCPTANLGEILGDD